MRPIVVSLWLAALIAAPGQAAAPITAAALAPDGRRVVLGSQNGVEVRSWPDLRVESMLPTDLAHVHDLKFSPDGRTLLAAGGAPAEEGVVEVLSWPDGKRLRRVTGHADVVYRVAWSPDGTRWATAGGDGVCQTFDAATGERRARYDGHSRAVLALAFLPDGQTVASVGVDQTLRLWQGDRGTHIRTLDNHVGVVNGVAVRPVGSSPSPSPTIVATISDDRTVRLWQPTIGRLMRFARLPSRPRSLAWSAAGDRLFVGSDDGRLRVLDPETAAVVGDQVGLDGRIHELVVDRVRRRVLIAGASGCRSVELPP